jgi:hypothetical protein
MASTYLNLNDTSACGICGGTGYVHCTRCDKFVCPKCHEYIDGEKLCLRCLKKSASSVEKSDGIKFESGIERNTLTGLAAIVVVGLTLNFYFGDRISSQLKPSESRATTRTSASVRPGYPQFSARLSAGAGCQELFDVRNSFDASPSERDRMNEDLRSVGCFSSSSSRTD